MILVRYAEIGLKSRGVRKFFERVLVNNMMSMLERNNIEALITVNQGRIFVETERIQKAVNVLSRVFGIASLSPAVTTGSEMEEMKRTAAHFSKELIKNGDGFAVRARREGDHRYTSQDVGREVGSAIYLANEEKGIHVDLTHPDVEIFVEVRQKKAFIFSKYFPGPGGLPMGSQGRVVALVETERDAVAAWLIMKRGCKAILVAGRRDGPISMLERWDPNLRVEVGQDISSVIKQHKAIAAVFGFGIADFDKIKEAVFDVPSFFPLVGMMDEEVSRRIIEIS